MLQIREECAAMKVPVEVSARHVHLSEGDMKKLFGDGYCITKRRELSQPGQFLCEERVEIIGPKSSFGSVAILGPTRNKTQVEISITDSRKLGIETFIRESGDLDGTAGCVLRGPRGEVKIESGVIIAKRHIHMHTHDTSKIGAENGQICKVKIESEERSLIFDDVVVRVSDKFALAMHIDTDEGNAVNWGTDTLGAVIL